MTTEVAQRGLFKSEALNDLVAHLHSLNNEYTQYVRKVEKNLYSAFRTRWEYGKAISQNYDSIIEECGTQKEFAERANESEAVISNNKRAYEYLLDAGCETFDDVKELLGSKSIRPTIRNFEKIGTLLNEPEKDTQQKDQIPKDRKRLEELMKEVSDIIARNEPGNNPDITVDASDFLNDIRETIEYLESFNPRNTKFKSEKYLDFVRNFGRDLITMEPCEKCDPHHTLPDGGTGSMGETLPDYYAIPVSRKTHTLIGFGLIKPTPEEILEAQFTVMSAFINKIL